MVRERKGKQAMERRWRKKKSSLNLKKTHFSEICSHPQFWHHLWLQKHDLICKSPICNSLKIKQGIPLMWRQGHSKLSTVTRGPFQSEAFVSNIETTRDIVLIFSLLDKQLSSTQKTWLVQVSWGSPAGEMLPPIFSLSSTQVFSLPTWALCPRTASLQWATPLYNNSFSLTNHLQNFTPFWLISIYRLAHSSTHSMTFGTLLFNKQRNPAWLNFIVWLLLDSALVGA